LNLDIGKKIESMKLQLLFIAFNKQHFSQPGFVIDGVFLVG
jgi:hypothetical protein